MIDTTVIYYTSNRETETFEDEIIKELLISCGDLPIVSVSQKPIKLGKNICVGDVGASNINTKRQVLLGLAEAKTKYVHMAEADFLYPPEYFQFIPERDDTVYYLDNLFIIWKDRPRFHRKRNSDGALVCNRVYLKNLLSKALEYAPEWFDGRDEPNYEGKLKHNTVLYSGRRLPFTTKISAVSFKTGNGVSWSCPHSKKHYKVRLPRWGTAQALNERFK